MKTVGLLIIILGVLLLLVGMLFIFISVSAYLVGVAIFASIILNVVGAMLLTSKKKK